MGGKRDFIKPVDDAVLIMIPCDDTFARTNPRAAAEYAIVFAVETHFTVGDIDELQTVLIEVDDDGVGVVAANEAGTRKRFCAACIGDTEPCAFSGGGIAGATRGLKVNLPTESTGCVTA